MSHPINFEIVNPQLFITVLANRSTSYRVREHRGGFYFKFSTHSDWQQFMTRYAEKVFPKETYDYQEEYCGPKNKETQFFPMSKTDGEENTEIQKIKSILKNLRELLTEGNFQEKLLEKNGDQRFF